MNEKKKLLILIVQRKFSVNRSYDLSQGTIGFKRLSLFSYYKLQIIAECTLENKAFYAKFKHLLYIYTHTHTHTHIYMSCWIDNIKTPYNRDLE